MPHCHGLNLRICCYLHQVAEVCICYTGDLSSPDEKIYTVEYYTELATRIAAAGAHFICIKDMAGLMKPRVFIFVRCCPAYCFTIVQSGHYNGSLMKLMGE